MGFGGGGWKVKENVYVKCKGNFKSYFTRKFKSPFKQRNKETLTENLNENLIDIKWLNVMKKWGDRGIESRTSCTLSKNHTPRPITH